MLREAVQQEAVLVLRVRLALRRAAVRELELRQGRLVLLDELLERRLVALQAVSASVLLCSRLAAHLDLQDLGLAVLDGRCNAGARYPNVNAFLADDIQDALNVPCTTLGSRFVQAVESLESFGSTPAGDWE